jgi:hypothetical protein
MFHDAKNWVDVASIGTVLATLAGWFPAIAALASVVWTLIRIYETKTVQSALFGKDDA